MHTQPGQVCIPLAGAQYSAWLGHARAVWLHRSYLPSLSCHPLIGKNGRNELDLMLLDGPATRMAFTVSTSSTPQRGHQHHDQALATSVSP